MTNSTHPYTTNTGNLKKFLEGIPKTGVPTKVTREYLTKIGYTSSNDRAIINVLKFIGFLDHDGSPTEKYKQFRNTNTSRTVMAECLTMSYSDLFNTYPSAYDKDDESLVNFMRASSDAKPETLSYSVRTFKTLSSFADFTKVKVSDNNESLTPSTSYSSKDMMQSTDRVVDSPFILNVNVQITLPETKDYEVYEKIFQSLRKNILDKQSETSS
ncbi:MAG: DUF5343 domain-containing protein [Thermoplasmataceae archaeon]